MTSFEIPISSQEVSESIAAQASMLELTLTALRFSKGAQDLLIKSTEPQRRQFTLKEVSEHDSPGDVWVIIYDRVYDITNFLDLHPGGDDLLMEFAGLDASLAFRGAGHSKAALNMLKQYEIGELIPAERIFRGENKFNLSDMPE